MRVLLHDAGAALFTRSGIGQAVRQQAHGLDLIGATRVRSLRENPHVVQLNFATPSSLAMARRARAAGIPVVYVAHSTPEDSRGSIPLSDQFAPVYWRFLRRCYQSADLVLTPTPYSRRLLLRHGLTRPVEVLSNGVNTDFFCPDPTGEAGTAFRRRHGIAAEVPLVVSVGHWFKRKGIIEMIEVARRCPEVSVIWLGYTDPRLIQREVRAALAAAPENFYALGYVSREEVRDAYRAADLFALASWEETEGIVVLEALATGVPVLVRDIPVFGGWLEDGANCRMFHTTQELAQIVGRLSREPAPDPVVIRGRQVALERDLRVIALSMPQVWSRAYHLSR